jgi:hypothetical protein
MISLLLAAIAGLLLGFSGVLDRASTWQALAFILGVLCLAHSTHHKMPWD